LFLVARVSLVMGRNGQSLEFVSGGCEAMEMQFSEVTMSSINFGDLPSWINLVLTLIAVFAAFYAGVQGKQILEVEIKRDREFDLRFIQEQAKLISSWARPAIVPFSNSPNFCIPVIEACVRNNSNQPVFDIELVWWLSGDMEFESYIDLIPPFEEVTKIMPSELLEKYVGIEGYSSSVMNFNQAQEDCLSVCDVTRIEISFRDSENRKWSRNKDGFLKLQN